MKGLSYVQTAVATLLDAEFELLIVTIIVGIIVDHVEEDDKDAKLFLARSGEKAWRMIKSCGLSESETLLSYDFRLKGLPEDTKIGWPESC